MINVYEVDSPLVEVPKKSERLVLQSFSQNKKVTVRYLNHACLYFEVQDGIKFATDPWILGPAFQNGWWLKRESPRDSIKLLNECDFIYISHNHPDHLHPESLSFIKSDMQFLVPGFQSGSTAGYLRSLGFENIIESAFDKTFSCEKEQYSFSVLKSGDFRDDSGLMIQLGSFSALLTVDSNFLDFQRFPENIDLLCSAFAGGASGFPLCFENYSQEEKVQIVRRNRAAIMATNLNNIANCSPKYFMPYAGFFCEKLDRDSYIKQHNIKNSPNDYKTICEKRGCKLVDPEIDEVLEFNGGLLVNCDAFSGPRMASDDVDRYVKKCVSGDSTERIIREYFSGVRFVDDLVLYASLTDESFSKTTFSFEVDFRSESSPSLRIC